MTAVLVQRLNASLTGRYAIEREVGRGGMATVYLARDLRHDRHVALKVLDPELGAVLGADRFLAEIKVTANLQHPNLLPLFDSGDAEGLLFYVMPFVDGESLRAKLDRERQLPVDEAIRIATAVANALDYAHSHGVIHRDLKPENILLQSGQPVVADFGIALAVSKAGGQRITQTGLSLGTPQYMSPEQATGDRAVDGRTDIYSLGALTYEMLTGEPPHVGTTSQSIIAKLMTEEVRPLTVLRRNVPPATDVAVRRALEKLPADRFATGHEFAAALSNRSDTTQTTGYFAVPTPQRRAVQRELLAWSVAALALIGGVFAWRTRTTKAAANVQVVRTPVNLPEAERFALRSDGLAISRDGSEIFYFTNGQGRVPAVLQRINALRGTPLDISGNASSPAFSPDGKWLAFRDGNDIKKIPTDGGPPTTIGSVDVALRGMTWTSGDTLILGALNGLWAISARGGPARRLFKSDTSVGDFRWPVMLPDGKTALYITGVAAGGYTLAVSRTGDAEPTLLGVTASMPLGMIDNQLVYVTPAGVVNAVAFDLAHRKVSGDAVPLLDSVRVDRALIGAVAVMSQSGTLMYLSGSAVSTVALASESGVEVPILNEPQGYGLPRYSPDGKQVALRITAGQRSDIWIYDLAAKTLTRFTTEGDNNLAEWTPDGKTLLYRSVRDGSTSIWAGPADGSRKPELFYQPPQIVNEFSLSPDGEWLIYRTAPGGRYSRDIFIVPLKGDRQARPFITDRFRKQSPVVSPDGKWLAFDSDETGRIETYVRPFPGDGPRIQVSTNGGTQPK